MNLSLNRVLLSAVLPILFQFSVSAQTAPNVPPQYQRFFFQFAERRSLYERALNLVGQSHLPVGRSIALIIAVTQYPNFPRDERSLRPAAVDLEKLKSYLKDEELFDEIVVLKDGDFNLENLDFFLQDYFPDRLGGSPHARFLLAFSGHGYADGNREGARGFLLTSPATTLKDNVNRIDLSVLRALLDPDIEAAEKSLVLINSCQSGAFLGRKPFGANPLGPGDRGAHAIMASRTNQQSFQVDAVGPGSVFFEKILAGLRGAADTAPPDGIVTFHELDNYLRLEIPSATNGSQIPVEGDISRNGSVGEFFFLNTSRQVQLGNSTRWDQGNARRFGAGGGDLFVRGTAAFGAGRWDEALRAFGQSAADGNTDAMNNLGIQYGLGLGTTQDYQQARQWYEKAAVAGSAEAMCNLGDMYSHGFGVPQDYKLARQWYEKSADAGDAGSMTDLGIMYSSGFGVAQDYKQASQWYEYAAAAGSAESMNYLGFLVYSGLGVAQNYQQARQWFERAAAADNADGMSNLGALYEAGSGVAQDYQQALEWYGKAATAGSTKAMCNLGALYYYGRGVPEDTEVARQWYEKAAAAGSAEGIRNLGALYATGRGVVPDYQQARQWSEKAAAAGSADGMTDLGLLYEKGLGVSQDLAQARQWYEKAAAAGSAEGMSNLGVLYETGCGVTRDYQQAHQWYEKAAAAGNADGMTNLGLLYDKGLGVPHDLAQARQWYEKAAALGEVHAIQRLKEMKN